MNRSEAEALGVEALGLANDGAWGEVLALELPGQVLELVRQMSQLNKQVQHLEYQEKVLWQLIVETLVVDS